MAAPADLDKPEWPLVAKDVFRTFVADCMQAVGICKADAEDLGDLLLAADYRGHYTHGLYRLGAVVGKFCMDLAIKKAKDAGIGWVVAKGSNHFGIAGSHSMRAQEQGFVPCNDPTTALESGTMSPLGGSEECGGYKGYGLAMMVELFCGILGGTPFASDVRKWADKERDSNLVTRK